VNGPGWEYDRWTLDKGTCGCCGRRWETCRCCERNWPAPEEMADDTSDWATSDEEGE
jgi:hypothetical protein